MKEITIQNQFPVSEMEKMAVAVAKSGLFGMKTPEQALSLMLLAQAEGMHPAIAARDYHIVQGRPALKADSMLARFQSSGGRVTWNKYEDSEVSGTFEHPMGGKITVAWTLEQARKANLTAKDVWKSYPRAMLRSRVISEAIRTIYPGVAVGVYTPEELESIPNPSRSVAKSVIVEMDQEPKVESKQPVQTEVAEIIEEELAKAPHVNPNERSDLYKAIAKSGWSKTELSEYCMKGFSKASATELGVFELRAFSKVVNEKSFSQAMADLVSDGE